MPELSDRDLLHTIYDFIKDRNFVLGDEPTIRDMVKRYKQPPLTLYHQCAMQLTAQDYGRLKMLFEQMHTHLYPESITEAVSNDIPGNSLDCSPGNLSPDADVQ